MNVTALIPARCGSKSVAHKNIVMLGSYPLLAYSVAAARLSGEITDCVVSTDSREYADIARRFGARVPFLRPPELARDDSTDQEFFLHFFQYLASQNAPVPELVVHLRPTTPLRDPQVIDAAIVYMTMHPEASALRSMQRTHLTPYKLFRREGEFARPFMTHPEDEFYNLPRQAFEATYQPNGYVDIIRPQVLFETGRLHGDRIKLWETDPTADIDVREDLEQARRLLERPAYRPLQIFLGECHE